MSVDREDAARALGEIDDARTRTLTLSRYRSSGPYFVVWGVVCLVANVITDLAPRYADRTWIGMSLLGIGACLVISRRQCAGRKNVGAGWRRWLTILVIAGFFAATWRVLPPLGYRQVNAFISLVWAFVYMAVGVWVGWRIFGVGLITAALILFAYYAATEHYFLWMGLVWGGAMILSGLWLRRA